MTVVNKAFVFVVINVRWMSTVILLVDGGVKVVADRLILTSILALNCTPNKVPMFHLFLFIFSHNACLSSLFICLSIALV